MAAFVLVHNPLVGPATWRGVAAELVARGHRAVVPSLLAATRAGPPFADAQVASVVDAVAVAELAEPVVLAGHSGAGPLLPAIGEALSTGVLANLFVDAGLPTPGRNRLEDLHPSFRSHLLQLLGPGRVLPPWHEWWDADAVRDLVPDEALRERVVAELAPIPFGLFEEPLPSVPGWPQAPCGYLRLSGAYVAEEADAARRGWPVASRAGGHLDLVTEPATIADAMLALADRTIGR